MMSTSISMRYAEVIGVANVDDEDRPHESSLLEMRDRPLQSQSPIPGPW